MSLQAEIFLLLCSRPATGARPEAGGLSNHQNCKAMEFLNKIELRGVVGRADVNVVNGSHVCNFSVVTEYSTRDKEGNPVMDIVWFNVAAWEGREQIGDVFQIQKGMWIEVTGRVRIRRYMTQENEERTVMDVVARKIKVLQREDDQMQPQRDY